jgi:hypothetical protein
MAGKKTRVMYIEQKTGSRAGEAWIVRVQFSRSGRAIYYRDKVFIPLSGSGIYGNYYGFDRADDEAFVNKPLEPGANRIPGFLSEFWISGPKKNGQDRHALEQSGPVIVDEDVADEYWKDIRGIDRQI